MPVLLALESAPTLSELLTELKSQGGLDWVLPQSYSQGAYEQVRICGIGSLENAGDSELSFLANPKLREQLHETRAAAVFLQADDLSVLQQEGVEFSFL